MTQSSCKRHTKLAKIVVSNRLVQHHRKVMLHGTILAQHSVAMLEQCCTEMLQRCVALKIAVANRHHLKGKCK